MKLLNIEVEFKNVFSPSDLDCAKKFIDDIKPYLSSEDALTLISVINAPQTALFLNSILKESPDKVLNISSVEWIPIDDVLNVISQWIDHRATINSNYKLLFDQLKSKITNV